MRDVTTPIRSGYVHWLLLCWSSFASFSTSEPKVVLMISKLKSQIQYEAHFLDQVVARTRKVDHALSIGKPVHLHDLIGGGCGPFMKVRPL